MERNKDYQLSPGNATHDFKTNGTFELPIGPGKLLMGGSHGVLARVIEGWQTSAIVNLSAGQPANIPASYTNPTVEVQVRQACTETRFRISSGISRGMAR